MGDTTTAGLVGVVAVGGNRVMDVATARLAWVAMECGADLLVQWCDGDGTLVDAVWHRD